MKIYDDIPAEISHKAHLAHKLKLVVTTDGRPFRCDGCMEPGSGEVRRYRCDFCDFDLHTSCALPQSTLKHPLFGDLELKFLRHSPASATDGKFCNACGYVTSGLVYHWSEKDKEINLHPCCAALKMETVLPNGHVLELYKEAKQDCLFCSERGRPPSPSSSHKFWVRKEKLWAYRWRNGVSEGYLHVACMKKIAAQSWEETYQDSPGGGVVEASVPVIKGMLQVHTSHSSENAKIAAQGVQMGASIAKIISATAE